MEILLKEIERFDLIKDLLSVNHDILGVYLYKYPKRNLGQLQFFKSDYADGRIKLYWGVIGLVAIALNLRIEDVTAVVMAHELAHAYTHLGFDIDRNRWDSLNFHESDHALKEGLAQYYTERAMKSLEYRIPKGLSSYQTLLEDQPEAYKTHLSWAEHSTPEAVRTTLITLRKDPPISLNRFEEALKDITTSYKIE